MPNSSSSSSPIHAQRPRLPVDEHLLRELEAHRPWEVMDDMALAIIDQTYAAMVEFLGLGAPPEGGGPVKASQLVDPPDPDSSACPVIVFVEASATHCSVRMIDDLDADGGRGMEEEKWSYLYLRQAIRRPYLANANRRAYVSAKAGTVHLARLDGSGGGGGGGGQGGDYSWKKCAGDVVRADVSEKKGLLGVLDAMKSHLDAAIRLEDKVIATARASGCRKAIEATNVVKVRMVLGHIRRQVDVDAVMRARSILRCQQYMAWAFTRRRRPAAEMDVDRVDEADLVTKRMKELEVDEEDALTRRLKGVKV